MRNTHTLETVAAKWNSASVHLIISTCAFQRVAGQNVFQQLILKFVTSFCFVFFFLYRLSTCEDPIKSASVGQNSFIHLFKLSETSPFKDIRTQLRLYMPLARIHRVNILHIQTKKHLLLKYNKTTLYILLLTHCNY